MAFFQRWPCMAPEVSTLGKFQLQASANGDAGYISIHFPLTWACTTALCLFGITSNYLPRENVFAKGSDSDRDCAIKNASKALDVMLPSNSWNLEFISLMPESQSATNLWIANLFKYLPVSFSYKHGFCFQACMTAKCHLTELLQVWQQL